MSGIEPNWPSLLWFVGLWAACCVAFFVIAGMFPLGSRPEAARVKGGTALILWNAVLLAALAVGTVLYGAAELRWTSLVVAGGLVFLFAPALFQAWPSDWRDGRSGLGLLMVLQIGGLAALYAVAAPVWGWR